MPSKQEIEKRAIALYEAIQTTTDRAHIIRLCQDERQWLDEHYSLSTVGTYLSRFYNKRFKSIPLTDQNSENVETNFGMQRRHLFFVYCGLSDEEWATRKNEVKPGQMSLAEKLDNPIPIDPAPYMETIAKHLASPHYPELGAGLLAATGMRPIELLLLGRMKPTDEYMVEFKGQAKTRGESPVFERPTLFPAKYVAARFREFRRAEAIASLQSEAKEMKRQGMTQEAINLAIKSRFGKVLWNAISVGFGGVIAPSHDKEQVNAQALRSAYAAIATARHNPKGSPILYAARILGHLPKEIKEIRRDELRELETTIGYGKYRVEGEVPFPTNPDELTTAVIFAADRDRLRQYQERWSLPNTQSVITKLLDLAEERIKLQRFDGSRPKEGSMDRVDRAVRAVMNYNATCVSIAQRWRITTSLIRTITGTRHEVASQWMVMHESMIENHHIKHQIESPQHNSKFHRGDDIHKYIKLAL